MMQELEETLAKTSIIVEANPQINVLFDSSFNVVNCNPAALRFIDFETKEEFIAGFFERFAKSLPKIQPDGRVSKSPAEWLMIAAKDGYGRVETEIYIGDKTKNLLVEFVKIPYGNTFAIMAYAYDMTEMRNREKELIKVRELNELQLNKLNLIINATKIALWDMYVLENDPVNPANNIVYSDEFRHMLGYSNEIDFPNILSSWSDKLHPEDKDRAVNAFAAHMLDKTGKTPFDIEYRLLKRDGNYSYYHACGETVRNADGDPMHVMGALMDITETKNILLNTERLRQEAEAASKSKSNFLSNMSHEMRTPMNAIIGMTIIGKKTDDIVQKNHALNKIGDASSHLLGVISDVLDMAKIEADKLELAPIEYNFEKMLQKVLSVINFRLEEKQQQLTLNVDGNIPHFLIGDEQRLSQVITNLLSNAVKFTPEKGKICIEAFLAGEFDGNCELRIEVTDNGIGIAPEKHKKLFSAFEQAESGTSRQYGGTGLGLAISKHIVEVMDGKIWIESELGKGAKFIFTVKMQRSDRSCTESGVNESLGMPDDTKKDNAAGAGEFEGKNLLVAEDVEINREILIALLEGTGLSIDCAENGKDALKMVEAAPDKYDIVFMDIQMPSMNGYEATRCIRALPERQRGRLPIIALTANVFKSDIDECLAAGMDDHLGKPLDIDRVIEKLRAYT